MKTKALGVLIISSLFLAGCSIFKPDPIEINLNDYLVYEVTGYDEDGELTYSVRLQDILNDYEELDGLSLGVFNNCVHGSWTRDSELSNDDVITFEWNVSASGLEDTYNVIFNYENIDVTVNSLVERQDFDPFEYLDINVYGTSGYGGLECYSVNTPVGTLSYNISDYEYLSNGDVITVTLNSIEHVESVARENGYRLTRDTYQYTVSGLDEYVSSISQISESNINMLFNESINAFYAEHNLVDSGVVINSLDYDGMYLLVKRNPGDYYYYYDHRNECMIVMRVSLSRNEGPEVVYYYYVTYNNLLINEDGSMNIIYDFSNKKEIYRKIKIELILI